MHSAANSLNETEIGGINPDGTQRGFQKMFNAKYLYQNQAPDGEHVQIQPPGGLVSVQRLLQEMC